ncbi:hypothetical protein BP00DRAFT_338735, partial [Aspergillus indologenus CBS 114.80]
KLNIIKKYFNKNLNKSFIYFSTFLAAVLVFLIYKFNNSFYIYIDYYTLNKIIIKNYYFILLINKIFNQLSKAVVFTKLNIIYIFNRLYIKKG